MDLERRASEEIEIAGVDWSRLEEGRSRDMVWEILSDSFGIQTFPYILQKPETPGTAVLAQANGSPPSQNTSLQIYSDTQTAPDKYYFGPENVETGLITLGKFISPKGSLNPDRKGFSAIRYRIDNLTNGVSFHAPRTHINPILTHTFFPLDREDIGSELTRADFRNREY